MVRDRAKMNLAGHRVRRLSEIISSPARHGDFDNNMECCMAKESGHIE